MFVTSLSVCTCLQCVIRLTADVPSQNCILTTTLYSQCNFLVTPIKFQTSISFNYNIPKEIPELLCSNVIFAPVTKFGYVAASVG